MVCTSKVARSPGWCRFQDDRARLYGVVYGKKRLDFCGALSRPPREAATLADKSKVNILPQSRFSKWTFCLYNLAYLRTVNMGGPTAKGQQGSSFGEANPRVNFLFFFLVLITVFFLLCFARYFTVFMDGRLDW
jgi:hypothetical protein